MSRIYEGGFCLDVEMKVDGLWIQPDDDESGEFFEFGGITLRPEFARLLASAILETLDRHQSSTTVPAAGNDGQTGGENGQ